MFAIEGLAPFLMFGLRPLRRVGAALLAGLQVMLALTGNYGFFNLLTVALCVLLLDDGILGGWRRRPPGAPAPPVPRTHRDARRSGVTGALAVGLFLVSLVPFSLALGLRTPGPARAAYRSLAPFHLVNPYGLFAVMTTERPEIVIEGSRDGRTWVPYEFRYKPGDVGRRPGFVAPHMPRLDWQMWFAALGDVSRNRWFLAFCRRLLEGKESVTRLLARDPFAGEPPRYVRAEVYLYRFTTPAERAASGAWWSRTRRGSYVPPLSLRDGRLQRANPGS
jgi:hypothetical protein